ncbi:HTH-type transcriptional repressor SmtB [Corynebacterium kalinowskii]|uniref:HTH-type transcriptional repressor SmtB n=1 Tax=Corynebacterium kalinowskii TaxID=2675216 RepID=A0A6B8VS87_9CORY|nr:metalloregulator ArsR/SmtB family transcription factor [Corynebacterium kalinowskii]QGU01606.1 HTH-type transcriptional repressor SmtB [Corynebacterium kalinowskii]
MNTKVETLLDLDRDFAGAEKIIRALDSQLRMKILYLLKPQPRCVHELVEYLGSSQPLISQHLKVLRSAGLVSNERRGREMYYSLTEMDVIPILEATFARVRVSDSEKL